MVVMLVATEMASGKIEASITRNPCRPCTLPSRSTTAQRSPARPIGALEVDDPDLDIVQQETFGPVLTLQVFEHEEEGVALANRSEYGLAAGVWTRDVARAFRVARKIRAGTVWINDWAKVYDEFEEGGYRQSGLGRLNGVAALDDFVEYKHISLTTGAA